MNHKEIKKKLQKISNESVEKIEFSAELGMYYHQVKGTPEVDIEIEVRDRSSHSLVSRLRIDASSLARLLSSRQCLADEAVVFKSKFHGRQVCRRISFMTPPFLYPPSDEKKATDDIENQMILYIVQESLENQIDDWRFLGAHLDNKGIWTGTYEMFLPYGESIAEETV